MVQKRETKAINKLCVREILSLSFVCGAYFFEFRGRNLVCFGIAYISMANSRRKQGRHACALRFSRVPIGTLRVEGKENSLFPEGPVIKCFVIPLNSKIEKKVRRNRLLYAGRLTNLPQFQGIRPDHVRVEYCFPQRLVIFCSP